MALRTDRRAAVYRRLWGWPLRSPAHLVAAAAGATVLALGLGTASSLLRTPPPSPPAAPPAQHHAPTRPAPAPAPPPVPVEALAAAGEFGQRWTQHPAGLSGPAFLGQLQPVVMPEYGLELATVDPTRIPDTQLTGPPRPVGSSGPGTAEVDLPTNAQVLHLAMVQTPQGWKLDHLREPG